MLPSPRRRSPKSLPRVTRSPRKSPATRRRPRNLLRRAARMMPRPRRGSLPPKARRKTRRKLQAKMSQCARSSTTLVLFPTCQFFFLAAMSPQYLLGSKVNQLIPRILIFFLKLYLDFQSAFVSAERYLMLEDGQATARRLKLNSTFELERYLQTVTPSVFSVYDLYLP